MLNAIPTDRNIMRIGIPMVSGCNRCATKVIEDSKHLFFDSDIAREAWSFLGVVFNKPLPASRASLIRLYLSDPKPKDLMSCLSIGLACCALWEIWKYRNNKIFDNRTREIKLCMISWARDLVRLIPKTYIASFQNDLSLKVLRIDPPRPRVFRNWFQAWRPPLQGTSVGLALLLRDGNCQGAAMVRDRKGFCVWSLVEIIPSSFPFAELITLASSVIRKSIVLGLDVKLVMSSHQNMVWLEERDDSLIPWEVVFMHHSCVSISPNIIFRSVIPGANGPALALAATGRPGLLVGESQLPSQVKNSLAFDRIQLGFGYNEESEQRASVAAVDDLSINYGV